MTEDLFTVPTQPPDALAAARKRVEAARRRYRLCDAWTDETGEPIPREVRDELRDAEEHLQRAEQAELDRQHGKKS